MFKKKLLLLSCIVRVAGCATNKELVQHDTQQQEIHSAALENNNVAEPSVRFDDWQSIPELQTVYFDYDSYNLRQDSRHIVQKNAQYLSDRQDIEIIIEGHCDDRGTTEYNLALGQSRATAVRKYLGWLGINQERIRTISYGEEKPIDARTCKEAWAKNRRAEFKIMSLKK